MNNTDHIISLTVMVDKSGYQDVAIPVSFLSQIALSIKNKGWEALHLANGVSLEVVGFYMRGSKTGTRVIMIGDEFNGN